MVYLTTNIISRCNESETIVYQPQGKISIPSSYSNNVAVLIYDIKESDSLDPYLVLYNPNHEESYSEDQEVTLAESLEDAKENEFESESVTSTLELVEEARESIDLETKDTETAEKRQDCDLNDESYKISEDHPEDHSDDHSYAQTEENIIDDNSEDNESNEDSEIFDQNAEESKDMDEISIAETSVINTKNSYINDLKYSDTDSHRFDRLYRLGKQTVSMKRELHNLRKAQEHKRSAQFDIWLQKKRNSSSSGSSENRAMRLYQLSKSKQVEGRMRREEVMEKTRTKALERNLNFSATKEHSIDMSHSSSSDSPVKKSTKSLEYQEDGTKNTHQKQKHYRRRHTIIELGNEFYEQYYDNE